MNFAVRGNKDETDNYGELTASATNPMTSTAKRSGEGDVETAIKAAKRMAE